MEQQILATDSANQTINNVNNRCTPRKRQIDDDGDEADKDTAQVYLNQVKVINHIF